MIENLFVIGIGGSGNKSLRAFIHLCALGLGPKSLSVFMVDIDQNNGDVTLTRDTINKYNSIKTQLSGKQTKLFKTDITLISDTPWSPFDAVDTKGKIKLKDFIDKENPSDKARQLIDFFFDKDELEIDLDGGCKAHPNIGSILMTMLLKNQQFISKINSHIEQPDSGIFVFNSIFGGTGASGGPVVINGIVDTIFSSEGNKRKPIGAGILLPYFIVPKSTDTEEKLQILSETFDANAAAALPYYAEHLKADAIYLWGDVEKTHYPEYIPGKELQKNSPHYLEMFNALGAVHFLHEHPVAGETPNKMFVQTFGDGEGDNNLKLEDLSNINKLDGNKKNRIDIKSQFIIAQMILISLRQTIELIENKSLVKDYKDIVWLYELLKRNSADDNTPTESINFLNEIRDYFHMYSDWIKQMHEKTKPKLSFFNALNEIKYLLDVNKFAEISNCDQVHRYYNSVKNVSSGNFGADLLETLYLGNEKIYKN